VLWTNLLNFCASLLYHIIVANVTVSETSGCAPVYSVIWASWLPVFNLWALDTSGFQAGSTVSLQSVSLEKTTYHLVEDVDVQSANTQPAERPTTICSGEVSSSRQLSK